MKNFECCFPLLIKDEGVKYTNDPSDSGGPTKFGITITDVRKYIKRNATPEDVRSLTLDQAKSIYKTKYWDAISADTLPAGIDYACFDYGVNSGLGRVKGFLDGKTSIDDICDERRNFLINLANRRPKDKKYLKGWLDRVERVRTESLILAKKKDKISGPAGSIVSGLAILASLTQYIHNHPYVIIGGSVAVAAIIGTLIHLYRNRK